MKCPKCDREGCCRYVIQRKKDLSSEQRKRREPRIDFHAKCKKCGWEGEI